MGEAVKRIHENTPMSPLFRLEKKKKNSNKRKKRGKEVVDRSSPEVSSFKEAATRLLSQLLFSMPMKRPLDKKNELFFGLFATLFFIARMCLAIIGRDRNESENYLSGSCGKTTPCIHK